MYIFRKFKSCPCRQNALLITGLALLCLTGVSGCSEESCDAVPAVVSLLQYPVHTSSRDADCSRIAANIIPQPRQVKQSGPPLQLATSPRLRIDAPNQALLQVVQRFLLAKTRIKEDSSSKVSVTLNLESADGNANPEAYNLDVSQHGVNISASSEQGLFYGVMTLAQLPQRCNSLLHLPAVSIKDEPATSWRGLMLDVSRHFFPAEDIKKLLDTMAQFKLNRFHWHLSDDQGWRVQVPEFPELTKKGAWREGTQTGHDPSNVDGKRYGGFYTQKQIAELVQYAKLLHIEVVPEVDMPGHVQAAIAAYPDLGIEGTPGLEKLKVGETFGPQPWTLSPTQHTLHFAKDVLSELMALTQSPYVHIGGDEVSDQQWSAALAQAARHGKKSSLSGDSLRDFFIDKLSEQVKSEKKLPVVWDEAIDLPKLPKDALVVIWRPEPDPRSLARKAARQGHKIILSPQWYAYLDRPQDHGEIGSPRGDVLALRKVYEMPLEEFGELAPKGPVIGGQAALWTEYIRTRSDLEYMAWPRGCALAEVFWTGPDRPGFAAFRKRLEPRLADLRRAGLNFRELGEKDKDDSPANIEDQLGHDLAHKVILAKVIAKMRQQS
eukprot:TRINITY_DN2988_c0_g1_i10.p1 TRINITY_DN2988_c0_g1~~TRINITY_DN2988_c0_g1_i10.p1  ORF type:complete len:606 (-),score=121.52 TRINITY_DN2988_c0_g1_i10:214-2031(-)